MPRMVRFASTFRVDAVNQTRYAIPQMPAIAVYFERDRYCVSTSSAVWQLRGDPRSWRLAQN